MSKELTVRPITPADLQGFTGTEQWYRHWLGRLLYTDGAKFFADEAGAHWFLDIVATEFIALQKRSAFLSIVMEVADGRAKITVDDGNGNALYERQVQMTDCPPGSWHFYLTDNVLMVPTEY